MSDNQLSSQEMLALIHAACDERMTEHNSRQLAERLETDPAARQLYVEMLSLDTSLRYWAGVEGRLQARSLDPESGRVDRVETHEKKSNAWRRGISLAAALAGCLFLGWLAGINSSHLPAFDIFAGASGQANADDPRMAIAARVARFTPETQWVSSNQAILQGTYVRPGQSLELKRGIAEVQFGSGMTAILEGPAKFQLASPSEVNLQFGKVTLAANRGSAGIVLATPSSKLEMNAGEIGATVDEDGVTDVQVFSGSLNAALLTTEGSVVERCNLTKGSGRRFSPTTELVSKIGFTRYGYVFRVPESYIAYQNYLGSVGNQIFEGSLGMDFVVKDPIEITKLGVFDSEADGLKRPLRAEIWVRDEASTAYRFDDDSGIKRIAAMDFTPKDPGLLIDSNRFKPLKKPVYLAPGAYTIVTSGYGAGEPNGNEGNPVYDREADQVRVLPAWESGWKDLGLPIHALKGLNDGQAAILFVGSARWDEVIGQFPRVVDSGAVNRFQAGSFEFERSDQRAGGLPDAGANRSDGDNSLLSREHSESI